MSRRSFQPRLTEAAFTLIELVVAAGVLGILILGISNLTVNSLNTYQYLQAQSNSAADLTNLIDRVSRVVRGATTVLNAGTTTLTVYAYFSPNDAVVDQVRYFTSGNTLEVGVTPPSGTAPNYTYPPANEKVTTLATNLTMGSTPVFTYYDDTGTALPTGFALSQIRQVGVEVIENPNIHRLPTPLSNQTIVTLRNLKTNL
jgi:type II secretory pathway pseudopilin PulG